MNVAGERKNMRGNIACSLRYGRQLTYREVGQALGISGVRAHQIIKQHEAAVLQRRKQHICQVFSVNTHIEALGPKFLCEVRALCESLNGVGE